MRPDIEVPLIVLFVYTPLIVNIFYRCKMEDIKFARRNIALKMIDYTTWLKVNVEKGNKNESLRTKANYSLLFFYINVVIVIIYYFATT